MTHPSEVSKPCAVEGCTRWTNQRYLYCGMHLRRRRVTGEFGPAEPLINVGSGRCIGSNGYMRIYRPGHPLADGNGWVYEHRLVAYEAGLIQPDDGNHVHHINHDKVDNRLANLEVLSQAEHMAEHAEERRKLIPAECAEMYRAGMTTTAIAAALGTHCGNVSRALATAGVEIRPQPSSRPDIDPSDVLERIRAGHRDKRIARDLGCSSIVIRRIRQQAGIAPHRPGRPES